MELFISRKAVEYHLGNIYAKCGLQGRQELRRYVEQWHQRPARERCRRGHAQASGSLTSASAPVPANSRPRHVSRRGEPAPPD